MDSEAFDFDSSFRTRLHQSLAQPIGQRLAVVFQDKAILVELVADVAQLEIDRGGLSLPELMQIPRRHRAAIATARRSLAVFSFRNKTVLLWTKGKAAPPLELKENPHSKACEIFILFPFFS